MNCQELARSVQNLEPSASPQDVARMCLLLTNSGEDINALQDQNELRRAWTETGMRLQAVTDQHAAMTQELDELARSNPQELQGEQIWVLLRAIKVQSQILQMYVGHPLVDA